MSAKSTSPFAAGASRANPYPETIIRHPQVCGAWPQAAGEAADDGLHGEPQLGEGSGGHVESTDVNWLPEYCFWVPPPGLRGHHSGGLITGVIKFPNPWCTEFGGESGPSTTFGVRSDSCNSLPGEVGQDGFHCFQFRYVTDFGDGFY